MTTQPVSVKELAHREGDGMLVRLLWERETNRVRVVVDDSKWGDSFELAVAPGENPMDVFRHPYAYAVHGRPVPLSWPSIC